MRNEPDECDHEWEDTILYGESKDGKKLDVEIPVFHCLFCGLIEIKSNEQVN